MGAAIALFAVAGVFLLAGAAAVAVDLWAAHRNPASAAASGVLMTGALIVCVPGAVLSGLAGLVVLVVV